MGFNKFKVVRINKLDIFKLKKVCDILYIVGGDGLFVWFATLE